MIHNIGNVELNLDQLAKIKSFIVVTDNDLIITWASEPVIRRVPDALGLKVTNILEPTQPQNEMSSSSVSESLKSPHEILLKHADGSTPLIGQWLFTGNGLILLANPRVKKQEDMDKFSLNDFSKSDRTIELMTIREESIASLKEAKTAANVLKDKNKIIEEQKDALITSESFQRSISEALPGFVFVYDTKGVIQKVNRPLPGFREQEIIGLKANAMIEPGYRDAFEKAFQQAVTTGMIQTVETMIGLPDGHHFFLNRLNRSPLTGSENSIVHIATDITGLKLTEEDLARNEQLFSMTLNSATDMIFLTLPDEKVVYLNQTAKIYYGLEDVNILSELSISLSFFWCGESINLVHEAFKKTRKTHEAIPVNCECNNLDYELLLTPVIRQGKLHRIVCVARDVSKRKRMERQVVVAKNEAEELNKQLIKATSKASIRTDQVQVADLAKSRFIKKISDEIRIPINGVTSMVELLENTGLTDQQSKYIDAIRASGESLQILLKEIIEFSNQPTSIPIF